ncbi:glycosyltransferase family 2 protein [Bacteroides congonensis]
MYPQISIITINYNNKKGLARTLNSVYSQNYTNYEHIIIDANSSDGSKETIEEYRKKSNNLTYWVSEPDNGIYNGMNKGIIHAKGEYLILLNSGDFLENGILDKIHTSLTGEDLIYGNLNFISPTGEKRLQVFPSPPFNITELISPSFYLPHPATFIKGKLLKKLLYTEQYKIVSDWEFWLKAIIFEQCSMKHINICITNFYEGGISANIPVIMKEREKVLANLFPPLIFKGLQELAIAQNSLLYNSLQQTIDNKKLQLKLKKVIHYYKKIYDIFSHSK